MISSNADAKEMENILRKLNAVTETSTKSLVAESKHNPDLMVALNTNKTATGVRVAGYEIIPERVDISGLKKNYYTIVETSDNTVLYKDISLFESAMSIVKRLMLGKNLQECNTILSLDSHYDSILVEAYTYKYKMKRIAESVKRDVYEAKYTNALGKVKTIKQRILKTL